jgi:WD40 repeat protein
VHSETARAGEVGIWDTATGRVMLSPAFWPASDVQAVAFSPDGKSVAAAGVRGLRVWDAATGKLQKEVDTDVAVPVPNNSFKPTALRGAA